MVSPVQQKLNKYNREMYDKAQIVTWRFRIRLHASNFGIQFLPHNAH